MASIITTSQVLDSFLTNFFGSTHAVRFSGAFAPQLLHWTSASCTDPTVQHHHHLHNHYKHHEEEEELAADCLPFSTYDSSPILTLGYLITACLLLPLGLMNLKENVSTQLLSFWLLLIFLLHFFYAFISNEAPSADFDVLQHLPLTGSGYASMIGVVFFNFALTPTLPSLLSEKGRGTRITDVVRR